MGLMYTIVLFLSLLPAQPIGKCVLDETGTLTAAQFNQLENSCEAVDKAGDGQIEIVLTNDFRGEEKEEFTNKLFNSWAIGHKGRNDGVLVVLSPQMRKWRIEVGYGLEGRLTDVDTARLARDYAVPLWRVGKFGEGLVAVVSHITPMMHAEAKTMAPIVRSSANLGWGFFVFVMLFLGLCGLFIWWLAQINKPKRAYVSPFRPIQPEPRHYVPSSVVAPVVVVVNENPVVVKKEIHTPRRRDDTPPSSSSSSDSSWSSSSSSDSSSDSGGGFGGGDGGMSGGGGSGGDF